MMLEKFYNELENITSLDFWELLKQLNPIEEKFVNVDEERIKTERKVLAFSLNNGDLYPKTTSVDISGKPHSYPNNETFTDTEIDYLIERFHKVKNIWIKGRYSHVLWNVTRNNQYAESAIEYYIEIIDNLISDPESESDYDISNFVESLLFISGKTNAEITRVKLKIIELLKSEKLPIYQKPHILEITLNWKFIKPKDLDFVLNDVKNWVEYSRDWSFFLNQNILNIAIRLAEKLQKSSKEFYKLLAENQDLIINQHTDEKDFIRYISFGEKAKYYKKAGETEKYEDCLKIYTSLKNKFELDQFQIPLPEKETELLNEYLNRKSELILEMPIEYILRYFASGDDLLIKEDVIDKMTEEGFKNSFHQFCATSTFDINSNHKKSNDKEVKNNLRFRNYTMQFNFSVLPLLIKVFAFGIIRGKISYHSVFQYLQNNSWFGQKFPNGMNVRDIDDKSTWLSLIAPGLHDYFTQIEWAVMMKKNNIQNYILCIDSLTIKFEGALRDLIRLLGGTTTIDKRGELQEQLLEDLLQNKTVIKNFQTEDITLFTYVFTNKGWNLRNNVAHCFYPYSSYSFDKATLVFLCILKLGKYKLKPEHNDGNK